jgi:lon-related putative ATP-dependent protease
MARILTADEIRLACDAGRFRFATTKDVPPLRRIVGQERALEAIDFGLNMHSLGFNIFALGDSGTGKTSAVRSFISEKAKSDPVPQDWAYVHNFREPSEPLAVSVAPGRGVELQRDMAEFIAFLRAVIPKAFESKEYHKEKGKIMEEFQKTQKELFGAFEAEAESRGFKIHGTVNGFTIVAVDEAGEPIKEDAFNGFVAERKAELRENGRRIQERMDDVVRTIKAEDKKAKDALARLERTVAFSVLGHRLDEIRRNHAGNEKLLGYFDAVQEDVLVNIGDFKGSPEEPQPQVPFIKVPRPEPEFTRYTVNVIVNNGGASGAPCVFEGNPTYHNLFGRVEHRFQMGAAVTDLSMIRGGSLHKANGGFLVISAADLLKNIFSYDALKRAVRQGEVGIEDVWEQYRLMSTATMKPEPIPLNVKVILIGNPEIYYLLYNLDEEYRDLFKVKADFDQRIARTDESLDQYAAFVASKTAEEGLLPFDAEGVARVVDFGARLAENQGKLSTKFSDISNLLREACYWARKENAAVVTGTHVARARQAKARRSSLVEDRLRESAVDGTLIVETTGAAVGQVNGLAVYDLGDYSFGKPSRITASVHAGKGGVLNIERETKMSGKIHDKAVLILSNYLGKCFARSTPISLVASLTFEQLYGMIEGDSATCAELYALLSAISGAPVIQGFAVTGSMDQSGNVQPIGGVNQKVEGFFDLCRLRGLDGAQGVVIPERNRRNLMLKEEVVDAVRAGTFRIHTIDRVEEGIPILMGMPAGEPAEDGTYPEGTLYGRVAGQLQRLREAVREREKEEGGKGDDGGGASRG